MSSRIGPHGSPLQDPIPGTAGVVFSYVQPFTYSAASHYSSAIEAQVSFFFIFKVSAPTRKLGIVVQLYATCLGVTLEVLCASQVILMLGSLSTVF